MREKFQLNIVVKKFTCIRKTEMAKEKQTIKQNPERSTEGELTLTTASTEFVFELKKRRP